MIRNHEYHTHRPVLRGVLPYYHFHCLLCQYSLLTRWNPYRHPHLRRTGNSRPPSFRAHHQGNLPPQDQRPIVRPTSPALARYSPHPAKDRAHCSLPAPPVSLHLSPELRSPRVPLPCFTVLARRTRLGRAYRRRCGHRSAIPPIIRHLGAHAMVETRHSRRRSRSFVRLRHRPEWERGRFYCLRPHPAICGRRTNKVRYFPRCQEAQLHSFPIILRSRGRNLPQTSKTSNGTRVRRKKIYLAANWTKRL